MCDHSYFVSLCGIFFRVCLLFHILVLIVCVCVCRHFNLGLAYVLGQQPEPAIKHFSSAQDVLVKRRDVLDARLREPGPSEKESTFVREEVAEIDLLLPDIQTKVKC